MVDDVHLDLLDVLVDLVGEEGDEVDQLVIGLVILGTQLGGRVGAWVPLACAVKYNH